jgi:hypothetical protein
MIHISELHFNEFLFSLKNLFLQEVRNKHFGV